MDPAEQMLADAVAGLSPIDRASKLEAIGLAMAKHFAAIGSREKELFWLSRAQEARNEADRLRRCTPQATEKESKT